MYVCCQESEFVFMAFSSLFTNKLNICMLRSDDNLQSDDKTDTCKHGSEQGTAAGQMETDQRTRLDAKADTLTTILSCLSSPLHLPSLCNELDISTLWHCDEKREIKQLLADVVGKLNYSLTEQN